MRIVLLLILVLFSFNFGTSAQESVTKSKVDGSTGRHSESYQSFTFNGSWSWFSDPRAVYFEGKHKRTYAGWVDNYGNIIVGSYDHDTKEIATHIVKENLEVDDRNNPSILIDNKGKLLVFFNRVGCGNPSKSSPLFLVKAKNAEDVTRWNEVQKILSSAERLESSANTSMPNGYINPIKLNSENGKIYLFGKSKDGNPCLSTSDDNGDSWEKGKILLEKEPGKSLMKPDTKVYSDDDKKIHLTFTDGHPGNEKDNSIYYAYYENGTFYKADGSKIKDISELPLKPSELDVVYDAKKGGAKAWNCDIAEDEKGNPVIAYAKFPKDTEHFYCYAKWTGKKWANKTLINSGKWFPKTGEDKVGPKPYYSGGMSIDHENTNQIYLSVKRDSVFEIEKWTTANNGKSWNVEFITKGSEKDNVRPFAIRGAKEGNPLQVLWMQNTKYPSNCHNQSAKIDWADRFQTAIQMGIHSPQINDPTQPVQILDIMRQTTDWQFENPYDLRRLTDWHWGTYYVGLQAFYEITKEDRYKQEMINIGEAENWKINDKIFYADMLTAISNWAWLYGKEKRPEMIEHSKWVLDVHLATRRAYKADVTFAGNPYFDEWWTWCDALFVAPPVFARMTKETGEKKYLNYADKMFWITTDYLYCKEDSLMYRDDRYFEKRSENGKKIYWGRGNGWVISGITRMLNMMHEDYPSKEKYVRMYKEMAAKLIDLQGADGGWRVSLLDPEYQDVAEMSGSAFYVYALAWGLNNGYLDKKYRPVVEKGWRTLCANINENGRFGNVQPEGIDPRKFTPENWQVYGTGAFLMAGAEMFKLLGGKPRK